VALRGKRERERKESDTNCSRRADLQEAPRFWRFCVPVEYFLERLFVSLPVEEKKMPDVSALEHSFTRLRLCDVSRNVAISAARDFSERRRKETMVTPLIDLYTSTNGSDITRVASASNSFDHSPRARLDDLLATLDKLDHWFKRSTQQREFHKAFVAACLPKIFGADLHKHANKIMRDFDLDDIRTDVIVCAIRRAGKTMAVALFSAAFILTQPGAEVSIYSTGLRTSRKLMALIWKIITTVTSGSSVITRYNATTLEVACGGMRSSINSLPARVQIRLNPTPPPPSPLLQSFLHPLLFLLLSEGGMCACLLFIPPSSPPLPSQEKGTTRLTIKEQGRGGGGERKSPLPCGNVVRKYCGKKMMEEGCG